MLQYCGASGCALHYIKHCSSAARDVVIRSTLNIAVMLQYCGASGCALHYIKHCSSAARDVVIRSTLNIAVMLQYLQYIEHCCDFAIPAVHRTLL